MKYTEKQLRNWYEKYVANNYLYRVYSSKYESQIKTKGLNPNKNPFETKKSDLFKLFSIVLRLKKKGFLMMRWWGKPVDQEVVVKCTKKDLSKKYIDFAPKHKDILQYYTNLQGGALVNTILIFTEEILLKKPVISEKELLLVKKLNKWAKKEVQYKNKILRIPMTSTCLEKSHFQGFEHKEYDISPFGTFKQFKKAITKNTWEYYKPYLTGNKLYYIRTTEKIPAKELVLQ